MAPYPGRGRGRRHRTERGGVRAGGGRPLSLILRTPEGRERGPAEAGASDAAQANMAAVLSSVVSDGRATFITHGVLNLTHRNGLADPAPLVPGKAVPVRIVLNMVGQHVRRGHRLRLAPSTCRAVSDLARNGTFYEIPGLAHVTLKRRWPDVVAARLREIAGASGSCGPGQPPGSNSKRQSR